MKDTNVTITLNISSCSNKCLHCWAEGSPAKGYMTYEDIQFIIPQLRAVKEKINAFMPFFFFEPSLHPQFLDILGQFKENNLLPEYFYIPTNGYGFSKFTNDEWKRFKEMGPFALQFCLYGTEASHDKFAGFNSAYSSLTKAIKHCKDYDIEYYSSLILNKGNLTEIQELRDDIKEIDPSANVGRFLYNWTTMTDKYGMLSKDDLNELDEQERVSILNIWKTEKELIDNIITNETYKDKPATCSCNGTSTLYFLKLRI